MTSEVENGIQNNTLYPSADIQSTERNHHFKKNWPFNVSSMDDLKEYQFLDDFKIDHHHERSSEKEDDSLYRCSAPLCACCAEPEGLFRGDLKEEDDEKHACCDSSVKNSTSESAKELKKSDESFGVQRPDNDSNTIGMGLYEPESATHLEEGTTEEELQIYDTNKEEYEIFNLRVIHRKNRTGFEENKELPIVMNSVIAGRYYVTEYLGSAAFSRVVQAQDLLTGVDVCLKIIKNDKDFFDQSLDEIKLLRFVNKHDPGDEYHILRLYDYFYFQEHLFIVCELLRANLYEFQKFNRESDGEPYFTMNRLQLIARQCLEALVYLHQLDIIHCDLKPENILIKSYRRCEIKVIDLGSSCFVTDNVCMYVQSRSYRAPEVILGLPYDQKIDIWSLGCILAELYSGEVLFPNEAVAMLLGRMIGVLGPIDPAMLVNEQETDKYFTKEFDLYHINEETNELEYVIPEESSLEDHLAISDAGFSEFLRDLLEMNPERRLTSKEALHHPWLSYQYS
ncbi:probable serine/threonine-protein kinase dyrk2 isoform X2 [Impatiens glandulifera]|nr:probable serine/threonine-protein kinase dyrk2 isoform X2 [Impatiens glandulifera]